MKSHLAPPVLVIVFAMLAPMAAWSQVSISINIGPPPLPLYVQPAVPGEGYIWTPGYWSWNPSDGDYYWVPGTWVLAPAVGYLWTPGYWGFEGGGYRWHLGYWADHVGFYGGINYGYGYTGSGYRGGRWQRGVFSYNRSVNNVSTTVVHHFYNTPVNNHNGTRVSFNGGPGGVAARPSPLELQARAARHIDPTPNQVQHEHTALTTPAQRAAVNHGAPQVAATPRPSAFTEPGVVHARNEAATAHPVPATAPQQAPNTARRLVPPPPRAESNGLPPHAEARVPAHPTGANEQPSARGGEPQAARAPRAVQHVQEGPPVERPARARPEAAPHQEAQPHAQPQQTHPQPQQQPERAQPNARAEPRGQERPREER